jgi:hypothetical protein
MDNTGGGGYRGGHLATEFTSGNTMGTAGGSILSPFTSGGAVANTWAQLTEGMRDDTENSLPGVGAPESANC